MNDRHVEQVLRVLGYVISTHIMCRATDSRDTGRSEETLTADIRDLFAEFCPADEYLADVGSGSRLTVDVFDLNKQSEKKWGADFVLVMIGSDTDGKNTKQISKVIYVQAKRQDYDNPLHYAASTNHLEKAQSMQQAVGIENAFFAYYHADSALIGFKIPPANWPYGEPKFGYNLGRYGPSNYKGPEQSPTGYAFFIEPSAYRSRKAAALRQWDVPLGYDRGVVLHPINHFVKASGDVQNQDLPSVSTVITTGLTLPDFLVAVAECNRGSNLSWPVLTSRIQQTLRRGEGLEPRFLVLMTVGPHQGLDEELIGVIPELRESRQRQQKPRRPRG